MSMIRNVVCLFACIAIFITASEGVPLFLPSQDSSEQQADIAVIGGGCAGLAAAFTAAYLNHTVVVFAGDAPGGQLMASTRVENIPGIIPKTGAEVIEELEAQAISAGARIEYTAVAEVRHVSQMGPKFLITTASGTRWRAKAVVLAMGGTPRTLSIPGEAELLNSRIFTCALCDGKQTEGKVVYVIGGGDGSVDTLLTLHEFGAQQHLLVRSGSMRAAPRIQKRLQHTDIRIEYETQVVGVRLTDAGTPHERFEIVVKTPHGTEIRMADFLFYAIGHTPNTTAPWVRQLVKLDAQGYIVTNARQETSMPGVFAAGDIASPYFHQASYAIGCGQFAAKSAIDYSN